MDLFRASGRVFRDNNGLFGEPNWLPVMVGQRVRPGGRDAHARRFHRQPLSELAALPASAQLLNVIESVFSGMARSIIHRSDYASKEAAQAAMDRYFKERNEHFLAHPQRAGRKLWDQAWVAAEFAASNISKNPSWRR
jgi:hypothetical protein